MASDRQEYATSLSYVNLTGSFRKVQSCELTANRISELFGVRLTKQLRGKLSTVIDQIEHALIDRALARCNGVKTKAADFLGINRNTLNKKVKDLGIEAVD